MFFKSKNSAEYMIVGLGNPEIQYENTRHNIGFEAVDLLCKKNNISLKKLKFNAYFELAEVSGKKCIIMKPQTYMNNSGEAVSQAASFYKIKPENIIVFSDDISLDVGCVRIRRKGSAGGHNGLKSIIELVGSENFPRIKIGVGKKPDARMDLAAWVLGKFSQADKDSLEKSVENAVSAAELIVSGQTDRAMNLYNS